ncbi:MAG: protein kinase, partial [Planctomycetota bacterium]|nr:protein kinase [Planctomycetota bacterium]
MRLDQVAREIVCKVVYTGPGLSGKTTNLQYIHERAPKQSVGQMVSIDTESERTLHFDLLPLDLGTVQGYKCRFEFYTVPGQTYYGATRRMVLEGSDGIVFVADSRREMLDENVDALNDLFENLHHHGLPSDLPMVVQFNKQDLGDSLSPDQLNPLLNPRGVPWFSASAKTGSNILETMKKVTTMVIDEVSNKGDLNPSSNPPTTQQAPAASAASADQTWILTCHTCQSMLEVPSAKRGDIFTCGSCGAPLEVVDADHGQTKAPSNQVKRPTSKPPPAPRGEESGFGMQAVGDLTPSHQSALTQDASGAVQMAGPFQLDGYQAVARLDESVLGQRYRVRETASGRFLRALTMFPQPMRQGGYRGSIEPALSMANQVHHKGILKLVGMRSQGDVVSILSADAPDHEPLSHVLARRGQLNPPQALAVIHQMALALDEAARHGVIHGWLRPDVVLLNAEGNVLIDELGLPKPHSYLLRESMGASAATEHYLAPEHLVGDSPSDIRTDIFLMGSLLFRMLSGEGLVTGYSAHEALHKVTASGCRSIRTVSPEVSREIDAFCSRMTAIERKDRFQNHRDVLEALERLSNQRRGATMNLTRGAVRPPRRTTSEGGGTAGYRRTGRGTGPIGTGTGPIRRTGTGAIRGTGSIRRTGTGTGTRPLPGDMTPRSNAALGNRRKKGNNGLIIVLVILVLGAVAVAVVVTQRPDLLGQRQQPAPGPAPVVTPTGPGSTTPNTGPQTTPAGTDTTPAPATGPKSNRTLMAEAEKAVSAALAKPDDAALRTAARDAIEPIRDIDRRQWSGWRQALNESMPVDGTNPAPVATPDQPATDPT